MKIRVSSLSGPALKLITEKISCFIDDFAFLNEAKNKESHSKNMKTVSRYCNQINFNIFFFGGMNTINFLSNVYSLIADDFKIIPNLPKLK